MVCDWQFSGFSCEPPPRKATSSLPLLPIIIIHPMRLPVGMTPPQARTQVRLGSSSTTLILFHSGEEKTAHNAMVSVPLVEPLCSWLHKSRRCQVTSPRRRRAGARSEAGRTRCAGPTGLGWCGKGICVGHLRSLATRSLRARKWYAPGSEAAHSEISKALLPMAQPG